ncbi:MAG: valine--tRNA ligase [Anaerolineales bacterium]|nr:valine--tRNA ligase [Anaerolineales bacterium]
MRLSKRYEPSHMEADLMQQWAEQGIYHFHEGEPVYSVDTPPPTVSGYLHLGHCYSYSHTDISIRYHRMRGKNIFYPMGYDDNGLPTERLVEKRTGLTASKIGREGFIVECLQASEEAEQEYEALWKRLGLSVDWRYSYRTIGELARRTSQWSFVDLYRKGLVYRKQAPTIWCPECQTAIAQAELDSVERETVYWQLAFRVGDDGTLLIATTRPELLPACVAVFVHPDDARYQHLVGQTATVPIFGQTVLILADRAANPEQGTGAVMCCTFGDTDDVQWWYTHELPLIEAIGRDGKMTDAASELTGLPVVEARRRVVEMLEAAGLLIGNVPSQQIVRVHERCDTPVEYVVAAQWFVNVLEHKAALLDAGEAIEWYPVQMKNRYREWVENLSWDWCISRQRYFGVPFPVWYCDGCGAVAVADEKHLPIDPSTHSPDTLCKACGGTKFTPERDVMDTWATSSMTPQIAGQMLGEGSLYQQAFPFALRPQSHEIIRTWAFYTIVKSYHHFGALPWRAVAISGWGLAPEGTGKISKSKGGGPIAPMALIEQYSADAVRYWAASTALGKDSVISIDKVQLGAKLVNKLWNVARFSEPFLEGYQVTDEIPQLSTADRWILARLQRLIDEVTRCFEGYEHAAAKSAIETFFWRDLADNYLEMVKQRLYESDGEGARFALYHVLLTLVKLLAPILPYVTDAIYQALFAMHNGAVSVHIAAWPAVDTRLTDESLDQFGDVLIEVASAVRRFKSDRQLSLTTELEQLHIWAADGSAMKLWHDAIADLKSVTRARNVCIVQERLTSEIIFESSSIQVRISTH